MVTFREYYRHFESSMEWRAFFNVSGILSHVSRVGLEFRGNEVRARVRYSEDGIRYNILGPSRIEERRARADLDAICAAGEHKPTRAEYIEAMQAEALDIVNIFYTVCFLCV